MTQLTPHFSLEELTRTDTGLPNRLPSALVGNLQRMADTAEETRALLDDHPIKTNSGYRCEAVNIAVGGSKTSDHMKALALDFTCPGFGTPLDICHRIAASDLAFDQLIEEGTWVHLSIGPKMRRQVLTKRPGGGYRPGLREA